MELSKALQVEYPLSKMRRPRVFQILDVFIVEYLHIYAEILGVGLNYKHEIHIFICLVHTA